MYVCAYFERACAIYVPTELLEKFNVRLGMGTALLIKAFQPKPQLFINVVEKITTYCDCTPNPGEMVAGDVGIYASYDPVALDAASIHGIEKTLFKLRSLTELHNVDPWIHLKAAEKTGVGTIQYNLKTL